MTVISHAVDSLVDYFETLTPAAVSRIGDHYAEDAYFKDPFNEVRGPAAIGSIFSRMFGQVDAPRFRVSGRVEQGSEAFLVWDLVFRFRGQTVERSIHGVSHLRFGPDGRVFYHRDYWDTGEELYAKLPLLGSMIGWLRRRLG